MWAYYSVSALHLFMMVIVNVGFIMHDIDPVHEGMYELAKGIFALWIFAFIASLFLAFYSAHKGHRVASYLIGVVAVSSPVIMLFGFAWRGQA